MADYLDGKIYPVGTAGLEGIEYTFTRALDGTPPDLTNAAIALRIYKLEGVVKFTADGIPDKTRALPPVAGGPALTLALGTGLTRSTNTADTQTVAVQITQAQLSTLLGAGVAAAFCYQWVITPVGHGPASKPLSEGYDGVFGLVREGYSLEAAAKV